MFIVARENRLNSSVGVHNTSEVFIIAVGCLQATECS